MITVTVAAHETHGHVGTVRLTYDPTRPYQVIAWFLFEDAECDWVFARDLLAAGLHHPAGIGDVQVAPAGADRVAVRLASLDAPGGVTFHLMARDVRQFVASTYLLVAAGAEDVSADVDDALRRCLP